MGLDDDADYCRDGHEWRIVSVSLGGDGSLIEYECRNCPAVITRRKGELFPD